MEKKMRRLNCFLLRGWLEGRLEDGQTGKTPQKKGS
jgi:hypothetical protein